MKNIVKLFSVMFVAGAMMLVSCDPEPVEPTPTTPQYTITVTANNDAYGTVTGGGTYDSAATVTLTATPNEGYKFVNWNDGNTQNPRIVTVTANATYTANFEENAGVNITFGTTTWTAGFVNGQLAANAIMIAAAQVSSNAYPIARINLNWGENGSATTGTLTGAHEFFVEGNDVYISFGNAYVWYYENAGIQLSSTTAGDWWSKSCTANVTALDADALTVSMVVNAEMAYIPDILTDQGLTSIDLNDCSSRSFNANVINQTLTQYQGKSILKNETARIALAK